MRTVAWIAISSVVSSVSAGDLACWSVQDVRPGMVGYGLTVVEGTKPARFEATVLGVLRDVAPGRDMVVARFSGLGLEKTGVMSGMSGSPVYLDEKLLGAVAYSWEFGVEPIGGITPFAQMRQFADFDRPNERISRLPRPVGGSPGLVVAGFGESLPGRLRPIRTPVSVAGMSQFAFADLSEKLRPWGLVPVQGGAANPDVKLANAKTKIEPGSAVAVGLVTGDIAVTAMGTVTAADNGRIYAFGHPFMDLGRCHLPLSSAFIHAVMPLQSASFKVGSSLDPIGVVDADVSTGIAGRLGGETKLIPVTVHSKSDISGAARDFHCEIAPVPHMLGTLLSTSMASCMDGEGKAPAELLVHLQVEIQLPRRPPLRLEDVYSGERYQGPPGLLQSLAPLANLVGAIAGNPFAPVPIEAIVCRTRVSGDRRSATILNAYADRSQILPGETLVVVVELRPFRSNNSGNPRNSAQQLRIDVPLPRDLPPGEYTAAVSDARSDYDKESRRRPHLAQPRDLDQFLQTLAEQLSVRKNEIAVRVDTKELGIAVDGVELPNLPTGLAEVIASDRSTTVHRLPGSLLAKRATDWVIEGSRSVSFRVVEKRNMLGAAK